MKTVPPTTRIASPDNPSQKPSESKQSSPSQSEGDADEPSETPGDARHRIESYYKELEDIIQFGGSDNELNIRKAFQDCLSEYCSIHRENLKLIPELAAAGGIPDGTVKDSLRMARGYWEAKDTHDDLDAEIQAKFNRGYPRDNILFEDSQTAVLFQNREEAMRAGTIQPIRWQPISAG